MQLNQLILSKIKERKLSADVLDILALVERYLPRVEFVKSAIGLKNVLYIEEDSIELDEFPYFLSLSLTFDPANKYEAYAALYEQAVSDKEVILASLQAFFEKEKTTLYIEVGFSESILTNHDMFKVRDIMKQNRHLEPFEVINQLKKYPAWYEAKQAGEVVPYKDMISLLYKCEQTFIDEQVSCMEEELDRAIDAKDEDAFLRANSLYKELVQLKKEILQKTFK